MLFSEIDYIGIFDNAKVHKNQNTKNRPVIMFEIDFCIENGGTAVIDDVLIPIRKNKIVIRSQKGNSIGGNVKYIVREIEKQNLDYTN